MPVKVLLFHGWAKNSLAQNPIPQKARFSYPLSGWSGRSLLRALAFSSRHFSVGLFQDAVFQ
jgi:hypothetical protein